MRQFVSAVELRFQALEIDDSALFDTGDSDDLDNRYSQLGHTHVESEITDLQNYLTNITGESIFDLSDVTGTPQDDWVLVWDSGQNAFVVQAPGAAGAVALNDLSNVNVPAPNDEDVLSWDQGSGQWVASAIASGGVNTLVDLLDTDMSGQLQRDLLFNADGSEWQPTGQSFQWYPGEYVQLGNNIGINWYDSVAASTEMLVMETTEGDDAPTTDPDIGSVVLLVSGETASAGSNTFTADIGQSFTAVENGGGDASVSTLSPKFGNNCIRCFDATGAVAAYFQADADDANLAFGSNDFTIEFHVFFPATNGALRPMMGMWDTGDRAWNVNIAAQTLGDFRITFGFSTNGSDSLLGGQKLWGLGALNTWYHVAISRNGNNLRYFVDGTQVGSTDSVTGLTMNAPTTPRYYLGDFQSLPVSGGPQADTRYDNVRITNGVGRYTTNFTAPAAPFDGTSGDFSVERFVVGDPLFDTVIDGLTTNITSTATDIDGSLNVDDFITANVILDDATGDEVAFALNYTTNKATSGADTGFQMTMTDTLSPGTSLFADYRLGAVTLFDWGIDGSFTIYDPGGTDSVALSHDGSNFHISATNTGNVIIDGTGAFFVDANGLAGQASIGAQTNLSNSSNAFWLYNDESFQYLELVAYGSASGNSPHLYYSDPASDTFEWQGDSGVLTRWIDTATRYFDLVRGTHLRIYNSTTVDFADFSHDGTDFNTTFIGTTSWNISDLATINLRDGPELVFWDLSNTNSVAPLVNGTVFDIDNTNITDWYIRDLIGNFWLRDGAGFKISDSTDADFAIFSHDGTDFNAALTNTTDWNITGHTGSVAFDNILAVRSLDNTDAGDRRLEFQYQDGTLRGSVSAENQFILRSYVHGASLQFLAEDGSGNLRTIMTGDPDGDTLIRGDTSVQMEVTSSGTDVLRYLVSNGYLEMYETGSLVARTRAASLGGFEIDNQASGAGIERALSVSDYEAGQPVLYHNFNGTITSGDPGTGNIRFNSVTMASVTECYISTTSDNALDARRVLDTLTDGDAIYFGQVTDTADYLVASVNGTPTDNTTWYSIPLTVIGSGTQPSANQPVAVTVNWRSDLSGGGVVNTDINTATPPTTEAVTGFFEIQDLAGDDTLARFGYTEGANDVYLKNQMHGGGFNISVETSGGAERFLMTATAASNMTIRSQLNFTLYVGNSEVAIQANKDSNVTLYHNAIGTARTATKADGGFTVDNEYNGSVGFERVLSLADITQGLPVLRYQFSTGVGGGDPTDGIVEFNNATAANITQVNFDDLMWLDHDGEWLFPLITKGDILLFKNEVTESEVITLKATDVATDQTGYWTLPVEYVSGAIPTDAAFLRITWYQIFGEGSTSYTPTGTTQTLDYADGPAFEVDLESVTGNITITLSNPPASGLFARLTVKVTQDSAVARTITWAGGTFRWDGGTAHPMNSTLDGISIFHFETWDGGTTWDGSGADFS